ncbi:hypothetical protein [Streptomyces sp. NBC_00690]|uniref:hypothetical protein n=1 Tax=Streptomyces sp. NBC_00690 TaxID=2975808 RepID=UPI002E2E5A59|nr:hypothetical protein [Streptomyces sp. NBC_00690]
MEWLDELLVEYGKGLDEDLAALTAARGVERVRVVELDATHAMLLEEPLEVAELVAGFLA